MGLKESKQTQRSLEKEVVNPLTLWEIENKQGWAKEARSNELSE